jgi:carbon monoxide dehydrogenase subunit G
MKVEGTQQIRALRERVFQLLTDPEVLRRCIPGCESLEKIEEDTYAATIKAGIGAIKGTFTGTVRLENMRVPEHYRITVDGKGSTGFVKGAGDFDLEEQDGATLIKYSGEMQMGGPIAGVGQRMVQAAAKMMAAKFFTTLDAEAQAEEGDAPPKAGLLRASLRRLSG